MATAYECMTLEQMIARMKHYHPNADASLVERAYAFAERVHGGQRRLSGEPYIIHPVYVASILTEIGIDAPTIAAGLLHDTVEDCKDVTLDVIRQEFGEEVAMLVDGVTKLSQLDFTDREERQAETLRKMILAMGTRYPRGADQAGRPAAQYAHAASFSLSSARWPSPAKRWIFTRRWHTAWAYTPSRPSWRICRCAISIPRAIRMWRARWA